MRKAILVSSTIGGAIAAIGGPALALLVAAAALLAPDIMAAGGAAASVVATGVAFCGLALGAALAVPGWRALASMPGRSFRLPAWYWWLAAFLVITLLGLALLGAGRAPAVAPFHVAAVTAAALGLLSWAAGWAGRSGGKVPARPAFASIGWGGLGGVLLALVLEVVIVGGILVAALGFAALVRPQWIENLRDLTMQLQAGGGPDDLSALEPLLRSPMAIFGVLVVTSLLVPIVEEAAKGLAVPLVRGTGRRLSELDGFVFGAAAGAGFALTEGIFNGALGVGQPGGWGFTMAARSAASGMHILASGLVGLGWQQGLAGRSWWRALGLFVAAVLLHGLWNFAALGSSLAGLGATSDRFSLAGSAATLGGILILTTLTVGMLASLAWIPRQLAIRGRLAATTLPTENTAGRESRPSVAGDDPVPAGPTFDAAAYGPAGSPAPGNEPPGATALAAGEAQVEGASSVPGRAPARRKRATVKRASETSVPGGEPPRSEIPPDSDPPAGTVQAEPALPGYETPPPE
jgi:RsiW-degrading membrane proteinase PrsW (M82 family)